MTERLKPITDLINLVPRLIYGIALAALGALFLLLGIVISSWILLTIGFTALLLGFIVIAIDLK